MRACFYGARKGGIALGLLGGIGIVVLVFLFKLPPGTPPVDVMLTLITIPSTLIGVLMVGAFSWFRGKDLTRDEDFQKLVSTPEGRAMVYGETKTLLDQRLTRQQWAAMWIFVAAIVVVATLGAAASLRPVGAGKPLSMVLAMQMFMLMAGALIVAFTRTNPTAIGKTKVFRAGMIAVVPLGLAIGVPPGCVVAFAAACYGYYILPTYPSDLATIQFDRSGTTHIGKYVINHSFIGPGLIGVSSSCLAGYLMAVSRGLV